MNLIRAFTEHPASVGETYTEHLANAVCFGTRMMLAGIACLVHGVLPFLFVRGSHPTLLTVSQVCQVSLKHVGCAFQFHDSGWIWCVHAGQPVQLPLPIGTSPQHGFQPRQLSIEFL